MAASISLHVSLSAELHSVMIRSLCNWTYYPYVLQSPKQPVLCDTLIPKAIKALIGFIMYDGTLIVLCPKKLYLYKRLFEDLIRSVAFCSTFS